MNYQDHEIFKRQIRDKEKEYFQKKKELEELKKEILWNIDKFEEQFGQTDYFNDMKKEQFTNKTIAQYAPGTYPQNYRNYQKPPKSGINTVLVIIIIILICFILGTGIMTISLL